MLFVDTRTRRYLYRVDFTYIVKSKFKRIEIESRYLQFDWISKNIVVSTEIEMFSPNESGLLEVKTCCKLHLNLPDVILATKEWNVTLIPKV